jgi:hypothetical protein
MSDRLQGPNQAQAMLHRVSPEGRAQALRERQRRQRQAARRARPVLAVAIVMIVSLIALGVAGVPMSPGLIGVAAAVFLSASALIAFATRARPVDAARLDATPIAALPEATASWLDARRPALPAPAVSLVNGIEHRLEAMAPQLSALDPREPAADSVRRLLAVELPGLIGRYERVPETLRAAARDGRPSADDHLLSGLAVIDQEIARMTDDLARGDFDALATQDRFLALKYDADRAV